MGFNLPHWGLGDGDPSKELSERLQWVQENFEELATQTARRISATQAHPADEALGEVTTTSTSFVELSGGPEVTIEAREGLLIHVLLDLELKVTGATAFAQVVLDGSTVVAALNSTSATYERKLSQSSTGAGGAYPGGVLVSFPATSTSHTLTVEYGASAGPVTASFKNRRLWAHVA
jgi:hypothetical protein